MQRLISFDIAKAICIILVVIGHYVPDYSPLWYVGVHDIIYTFHMPLFMFASGFIYMATKKDMSYKDFLWKKVKRLMVPYLSVSAIVITIKLLTEGHAYVENPVTWMSYVKMLYLPEAGYFLWFIWALWWMFVVSPLFKTKQLRLGLFVLAIVLHYIPNILPEIFCLRQFQGMLVYFMLGVVCCDWKQQISFISKVPAWCVFGFFAVAEGINLMDMGGQISMLLPYLGIAAVMAFSSLIEKLNHKSNEWLMGVSSSSYIIYLFHTTFEGFAKAVVHRIPFLTDGNDVLFIINASVVVGCGVVCPIILHRYVLNKTHFTKVLFGLK